jgi:hypothetical protein
MEAYPVDCVVLGLPGPSVPSRIRPVIAQLPNPLKFVDLSITRHGQCVKIDVLISWFCGFP